VKGHGRKKSEWETQLEIFERKLQDHADIESLENKPRSNRKRGEPLTLAEELERMEMLTRMQLDSFAMQEQDGVERSSKARVTPNEGKKVLPDAGNEMLARKPQNAAPIRESGLAGKLADSKAPTRQFTMET
jgi:hypothetical protein